MASWVGVRTGDQIGQPRCPQSMLVGNLSNVRDFRDPAPVVPLLLRGHVLGWSQREWSSLICSGEDSNAMTDSEGGEGKVDRYVDIPSGGKLRGSQGGFDDLYTVVSLCLSFASTYAVPFTQKRSAARSQQRKLHFRACIASKNTQKAPVAHIEAR